MAAKNYSRTGVLLLAALAFCTSLLAGATIAAATPEPEEIMSLATLQAKLDSAPAGVVEGYFKTVLKGSTISTLPCEILAITSDDSGASNAQYGLIMFRGTGAQMESFGGIVAGMSGSPIYVEDGGVDKVVGAISYGDMFTLGGTGLATPIEAMAAIEDFDINTIQSLSAPVAVGGKLVSDVVVTSDERTARAFDAQPNSLVFKPLATLSIGGLAPSSRGYKALAKEATKNGFDVAPLVGPLGLSKDGFSTDFEPGSAVGAMIARGDFWVGGIGTVTYENTSSVVAFGHPMEWDGATSWGLANAWIDGVWPSSYWPYKMGRPGAMRGTVTQDRGAGILGRTDLAPAETTITATVTDVDRSATKSGTSWMLRPLVTNPDWSGIVPSAVYSTALRAVDDYWYAGSVTCTTTVKLRDTVAGKDYTIVRPNIWDDSDVASMFPMDSYLIVDMLAYLAPEGVEVLSVDVDADATSARNSAQIVDVAAPQGLKVGANPITVSLIKRGVAATQTVDVTLTIPAGTPTTGEVYVQGGIGGFYFDEMIFAEDDGPSLSPLAAGTTDEIVAAIEASPRNDVLSVVFEPMSMGMSPARSVVATKATGTFLTGEVYKPTAEMEVMVDEPIINYNGYNYVSGVIFGPEADTTVKLYARSIGETTERYIGTVVADYDPMEGIGFFESEIGPFTKGTVITAVYAGDEDYLGARAATSFKVRAAVGFTASATSLRAGRTLTLNASVAPAGTTGTVVFEVYRNKRWQPIATRTLSGGKASLAYKPATGTWAHRVRYTGNSVNAAQTSRTITVKVTP